MRVSGAGTPLVTQGQGLTSLTCAHTCVGLPDVCTHMCMGLPDVCTHTCVGLPDVCTHTSVGLPVWAQVDSMRRGVPAFQKSQLTACPEGS